LQDSPSFHSAGTLLPLNSFASSSSLSKTSTLLLFN
jgi:hypothetical protein